MFKKSTKEAATLLFAASIGLLGATHAYAGGGGFSIVHDPWNMAQNTMTAANTYLSAANSAQSLVNEAKQIKNQLQNLKDYDGSMSKWADAKGDLQQLASVVSNGQGLSYTMQDVESAFKERYPDYKANKDYEQDYQKWDTSTMATIQKEFENSHMQFDQFDNETDTINQINQLSQTAEGRMQAVQAGNMIASSAVEQLQKLRELQMQQASAQNAYMTYKLTQDRYNQQSMADIDHNLDSTFPKYQDNPNFEAIPSFNN